MVGSRILPDLTLVPRARWTAWGVRGRLSEWGGGWTASADPDDENAFSKRARAGAHPIIVLEVCSMARPRSRKTTRLSKCPAQRLCQELFT